MSVPNVTTEFLLALAREAIALRAAKDGYEPNDYDALHDPEGYITSLLTALRHWCRAHGICWDEELGRSQGFFEQDLAESNPGTSPLPEPTVQHLRCPKCGHRESFVIEASECLLMYADGVVLESDAGMEWGNHSYCRCHKCDHRGTVYQFRIDRQDAGKDTCHG